MTDCYFEPAKELEIEVKIRKSRFISHIRIPRSEEEAREKLKKIQLSHKQATHNCWAYRIGYESVMEHFSDDGEPAGTAGKPILGALLRNDVTNCIIVITRYFGGTKLGVRGLIEAYGNCAEEALNAAGRRRRRPRYTYEITMPYDMTGHLQRLLAACETDDNYTNIAYEAEVTALCRVPQVYAEVMNDTLDEWLHTGKIISWARTESE
ncbi:MAG: IMPACT family protein [Aminivibrio sp.]|jgi:uncharacterized YigZ family protein